MLSPKVLPVFTAEDYLALERHSETRHEFLDGFVYAMAGESPEHSTICFNLGGLLHAKLAGTRCRGFSPNMKVRTTPAGLYSYPDLTIVCGEPLYHDARRDVLTNPTVIFEVLSRSTAAYDRGEKSSRYRTHIESLTDYVIIAQDEPRIEHHTRAAGAAWSATEAHGLDATIALSSIDCRIPLAEIYSRIAFSH